MLVHSGFSFHTAGRRLAPLALWAFAAGSLAAQNQIFDSRSVAPFVPSPENVVERMLQAAEVGKNDVVFDLGSGDGRILIEAARKFQARAVGVEINQTLVEQTRQRLAELNLASRVEVLHEHLMEADLSPATVVTVYLLSSTNDQLKPKFERELRPGTRIVSHDFQFRGWKPVKTVEVEGGSRTHRVYVYRMGEHLE
jgi:precorrin-6B methylase 2